MAEELTKDDLVILMESYRNMIVMHQTILDQTSKTIDKLDTIATKQDSLFSKQGNICSTISNVGGKIDSVSTKIDTIDKKAIEYRGKVINKIHLGWIGMATIIIGLIGLGATLISLVESVPK